MTANALIAALALLCSREEFEAAAEAVRKNFA